LSELCALLSVGDGALDDRPIEGNLSGFDCGRDDGASAAGRDCCGDRALARGLGIDAGRFVGLLSC